MIKICWYFYSHCDLNQFWKTTISRETTQANKIWCFDPADIQLISKYRKNNLILLKIWLFWSTFYICICDIFVKVLNIKTTNALQNILNETSLKTRKYGKIKMVNFPIDQLIMITRQRRNFQQTMKKNLLLLKDSLELWRKKFISICLKNQKICMLIN